MRVLQIAAAVGLAAIASGPLLVAREILSRLGRHTEATKLVVAANGLLPFSLAILFLASSLAMFTRTWPPSARAWVVAFFAASAVLPYSDWLSHGWLLSVLCAAVAALLGLGLLSRRRNGRPYPDASSPRPGPLGR